MKTRTVFLAFLVHICSEWYVHSVSDVTVTVSPKVHDCLQKYADVGTCKNAKTTRYTFNPTTKECKVFEYGGCGGSKNNFFTMAHCKRSCDHLIKEMCDDTPNNKDLCIGAQVMHKYTYNKQTNRCDKFMYAGCGNSRKIANVFEDHSECLNDCRDVVFNKASKPELLSGLRLLKFVKLDQNECVQQCRVWTGSEYCIGVAHDNATMACHLLSNSVLDEEQDVFVYNTGLDVFLDPKVTVTILAFRVSSGVGGDPNVVYTRPSLSSSFSEVAAAQDTTTPLKRTYRSAILDNWKTYKIKQVVMAYKKSAKDWGEVVFDAEKSVDKQDWMRQKNLVSSPWETLKTYTKTNNFNVNGHKNVRRRFYIAKHNGCPGDQAWFMLLVPGNDTCSWGNLLSHKSPEIIYAPRDDPISMICGCGYELASEFILQLKFNVV